MDILGIGPLELILILVIAFIVLGPSDMVKAGRTIGKFLRKIVTSPTWRAVTQTSNEIRRIPNKLIREVGLEEEIATIPDFKKQGMGLNQTFDAWQKDISTWTTPPEEIKQTDEPGTSEISDPPKGDALQD